MSYARKRNAMTDHSTDNLIRVATLRTQADWFEQYGDEIPSADRGELIVNHIYLDNEPFAHVIRGIKASPALHTKYNSAGFIGLSVHLNGCRLDFVAPHSTVCQKVETGTRTVEVAAVEAVEAHTFEEPVYETICPPLGELAALVDAALTETVQ